MPETFQEEVVCDSCGVIDDYIKKDRTFKNGSKHVEAICNSCGKHIKFLKQKKNYGNIPFGKYAGENVFDLTDLNYLKWLRGVVKSKWLLKAINERIKELGGGNGST